MRGCLPARRRSMCDEGEGSQVRLPCGCFQRHIYDYPDLVPTELPSVLGQVSIQTRRPSPHNIGTMEAHLCQLQAIFLAVQRRLGALVRLTLLLNLLHNCAHLEGKKCIYVAMRSSGR